jgi:hypothetical protein
MIQEIYNVKEKDFLKTYHLIDDENHECLIIITEELQAYMSDDKIDKISALNENCILINIIENELDEHEFEWLRQYCKHVYVQFSGICKE